jgi:phospholipase/carboxylesterase
MPKQMPDAVPEVSLDGLGSKPPTNDYELQHDGYDHHRRIFPTRPGPEPTITTSEPQEQLDQLGAEGLWDELVRRANELPGVSEGDSLISVKGARAFFLERALVKGPEDSLIIETEFAHIHPRPDSSWHLQMPHELAVLAISAGWGRIHTVVWMGDAPANSMMLYSPRNEEEMEVIWSLVEESYRYATGQPQEFVIEPNIATA